MRSCFSWFTWSSRSSSRVLRKSIEEDECETTQISQPKIDAIEQRQDSIADAAERIAKEFEFADDDVQRMVNGFVKQMNEGLRSHSQAIEQLPSFITQLPTGRETGTCLAVDLGGTNIRVCAVTFKGIGSYSIDQEKATIPPALMISKSPNELFNWVALVVRDFAEQHHLIPVLTSQSKIPCQAEGCLNLGFTFSHAVKQESINRGTLIRWSKGFDIESVVGRDVCALLQEAFDAISFPILVTALTNDTVGTLLAQAYVAPSSSSTVLGAVFGTGTNGAYVEKSSRITKQNVGNENPEDVMVVNTEWGNFDQGLEFLSMTEYDRAVDAESVNPSFEMFEKQISGMYLGELLRLALLSLSQDRSLDAFRGVVVPETSGLNIPWSLDTAFLSCLEGDISPELATSRQYLEDWLGLGHISSQVTSATKTIAQAIVRRSARLSAVALGAVLLQTGCLANTVDREHRICVGVDGSLIEQYPGFITEIRAALTVMEHIGEKGNAKVDITVVKNGSGVGAALAAQIAAATLI